jgi:GNAT superfamily N-acetyltransferase
MVYPLEFDDYTLDASRMWSMKFDVKPASDYTLPDLVQLLNLGFESYLVPIHFNLSQFLTMLRKDSIDLSTSRVLLIDEQPSGLALIARRGWNSRLAAMGITKGMRGKGAGSWFMERLTQEACERNDREMVLEVIEANTPAVCLYEKFGFQTVRRLISLIRKDASEEFKNELQEIDLREAGRLILQYGLSNLPWQLSGETIALLNPPARAYQMGQAYAVISNPDVEHVVIWSLFVESDMHEVEPAVDVLKSVIANHAGKTWHVPAIWPEEFGNLFEQAGFQREELSQWQMRLGL